MDREFDLAMEIESAVGLTSLLNQKERTATIVYHLLEYADVVRGEQREGCFKECEKKLSVTWNGTYEDAITDIKDACLNAGRI